MRAAPSSVSSTIAARRRRVCTVEPTTDPTLPHPGVSITSWACKSSQPPSFRRGGAGRRPARPRRQPRRPPAPARRRLRRHLHRPAVQHRARAAPPVAARGGRRGRAIAPASRGAATARRRSARWPTTTRSRTTSASWRRACATPGACSPITARSTSTSTRARATTSRSTSTRLFGRECFLNEIVWAYDYGAKTRRRWPAKHDTILVYVKDPDAYHFDDAEVERDPLPGPGARGAREGGARQAPHGHVVSHHRPDQRAPRRPATPPRSPRASCAAWWPPRRARAAGAWTSSPGQGRSARWPRALGRRFVLVDCHPDAIEVASRRCHVRRRSGAGAPSRVKRSVVKGSRFCSRAPRSGRCGPPSPAP